MRCTTEGKAKFLVGNAFYRHSSQVARDLGVLAAAVYRADTGNLKVLDAMAGCGVRSLRYWLESQADCEWADVAGCVALPKAVKAFFVNSREVELA